MDAQRLGLEWKVGRWGLNRENGEQTKVELLGITIRRESFPGGSLFLALSDPDLKTKSLCQLDSPFKCSTLRSSPV